MTVSIANRLIKGRGGLSDLAALALAFVDGGVEWLNWAAAVPAERYDFSDESTLVAAVQQRLHDSPLAWLPGLELQVSPVKLMTLGLGDLRTLAKAEAGLNDAATMAQVSSILAAHGLLTSAGLAAIRSLLAQWGGADVPLLRILDLNETIALAALMPPASDPSPLAAEAAQFALQQARTPAEFADFHRGYLALVNKSGLAGSAAEQRRERAAQAVQTLAPLMFTALDGPQVAPLSPPLEVAAALGDWLRQGRRLGFERVSAGICHMIADTPFTTESGRAAQQMLDTYLSAAAAFLATNSPRQGRLSQDGRSCLLAVSGNGHYAEVLLTAAGSISLHQFRPMA